MRSFIVRSPCYVEETVQFRGSPHHAPQSNGIYPMLEEEPVIGQREAGGLVCCYGNHCLERR